MIVPTELVQNLIVNQAHFYRNTHPIRVVARERLVIEPKRSVIAARNRVSIRPNPVVLQIRMVTAVWGNGPAAVG